jgi:Arc/MetJ family transcription regulator
MDENLIKEEDMLKKYDKYFDDSVKERGQNYYDQNKVISCHRDDNIYYSKVRGSQDVTYNVTIERGEDLIFSCDCPCEFECKHIYATLLAINAKAYDKVKLKEEVEERDTSIENILKVIPAQDLKQYIMQQVKRKELEIDDQVFKDTFIRYYPKQKYNYYYNNLFNRLKLNINRNELLKDYQNKMVQYMMSNEYEEAFKIVKAIVEAYNDSDSLSHSMETADALLALEMPLRIAYRKGNTKLKSNITNWLRKVKNKKYYENYYLEDIIERIKN